jgi:hypothetical protein
MTAAEKLEEWMSGPGRGRLVTIHHPNRYAQAIGWAVELEEATVRKVTVTGYELMEAADDERWPSFEEVVDAALAKWKLR